MTFTSNKSTDGILAPPHADASGDDVVGQQTAAPQLLEAAFVDMPEDMRQRLRQRVAERFVKTTPALVDAVRQTERRVAYAFAGQGVAYAEELVSLFAHAQQLRDLITLCEASILDEFARLPTAERASLPVPAFVAWLGKNGNVPDVEQLSAAVYSAPFTFVTQMARAEQLLMAGLDWRDVDAAVRPLTIGHSQGGLSALAWSCACAQPTIEQRHAVIAQFARASLLLGVAMQSQALPPRGQRTRADDAIDTPMAAILGPTTFELLALIDSTQHTDRVRIAVKNGHHHHTIAGAPAALQAFVTAAKAQLKAQSDRRQKGLFGGRVPTLKAQRLDVSGPFHTPAYESACRTLCERVAQRGLSVQPGAMALEVHMGDGVITDDGTALEQVLARILVTPQRFDDAVQSCVEAGVNTIVDCGPADIVAALSRSVVEGAGVCVLPATHAASRTALLHHSDVPALPSPYTEHAPRVLLSRHGERLSNRFVEATGLTPFILPGMTPTTADAPIVAAAANAGHWSELAGGGQVTEQLLRARMQELQQLLAPGRGIFFNALYLDPYLWGLQFKNQRLVFRLKQEGAPILGVTISAGIPPLDEAVVLLDELHAAGMTLNAFKPGSDAQLKEVMAIAKARPEQTLFVHIEGGKAGGHHSFEDLDDLLSRHYAALRQHKNLVICVGGGIATPEQATAYLTGTWSLEQGLVRMPVDAVLLGTRLMATREAKTSEAVKDALVSAAGTDEWPVTGEVKGGVTSGKSGLDSSIYYIENCAAQAGRLLDQIAGDATQIALRKDEIVAALSRTQKPYFGDIEAMRPIDVLARFVALACRADCVASTLTDVDAAAVALNEPSWHARYAALRERFVLRHGSHIDTDLVHPDDSAFFLEVCRRPGKPVPFVATIDADVRRSFKSDSLWQSHDERYPAQAVLAIPGPRAVTGIVHKNEPVAEVIASFQQHTFGTVRQHASATAELFDALAFATNAANVVDESHAYHPNPLRSLLGEQPTIQRDANGQVTRCVRLDSDGHILAEAAWRDGQLFAAAHAHRGATTATLELCLRLVDDVNGTYVAWDRQRFLANQEAFYARALFDEAVDAVAVGETAEETDVLRLADAVRFARATHDANMVTTALPLAMAFPRAWRAVFRALSGVKPDVVRLVHERESATLHGDMTAQKDGARVVVRARVESISAAVGGVRVRIAAEIFNDEQALVVSTSSQFFIRQDVPGTTTRYALRTRREQVLFERAHVAVLQRLPEAWVSPLALQQAPQAVVQVVLCEQTDATELRIEAVDNTVLARVRFVGGEAPAKTAEALMQVLVATETPRAAPVRIGRRVTQAPRAMHHYADASGDHNPLHTNAVFANVAGFASPIVHGMWTASFAQSVLVELCAAGDALRVRDTDAQFLAPLLPGSWVSVDVLVTGHRQGHKFVRADVSCGDLLVATLTATIAPATVAYVYPGQGVQHQGMGAAARQSSPAARQVWERADVFCIERHGFSLLEVVDKNPRELWVRGERLVHPEGVLFLTQFTQVALAVMAVADTAALRERGLFVEGACFAGHSLGEYSALAAVPQVMALEAVVDIVYQRGLTMDRLVPRDSSGASPYGMVALRPNLAGMGEDEALKLVDDIANSSGLPLYVVNYNVRGKQYAVTGDTRALALLKQRCTATTTRPAVVDVPGIDVPFHSPLLRNGVDAFRQTLASSLPERIAPARLEGRYVTNLTGTCFRLDRAFVQEIIDASDSPIARAVLADFDAAMADPAALAKALLVEVLAYQFASPVRWIAVQDALHAASPTHLDFVEVGPARAPVLLGMAKSHAHVQSWQLFCADGDTERLAGTTFVVEESVPAPAMTVAVAPVTHALSTAATAPVAPSLVAAPAASAPVAATQLPPARLVQSALLGLLCHTLKRARADIDVHKTLDQLVAGNSARRNQVLADMGVEFGKNGLDNAHELPLHKVIEQLEQLAPNVPGAVTQPALDAVAHKLLKPVGLSRDALKTALLAQYGLDATHAACAELCLLELQHQLPFATDSDGALQRVVQAYGAGLGVTINKMQAASAGGAVVDSQALDALKAEILGPQGVLARAAAVLLDGHSDALRGTKVDVGVKQPAAADSEHDDAYFQAVAPVFDARKHVALTSAWAWGRRDLLDTSHDPSALGRRLDAVGKRMAHALLQQAERHRDEAAIAHLRAVLAASSLPLAYAGRTALVTGAGEGSIARQVVARLLAGGARVVVTTSSLSPKTHASLKATYQAHAACGAELHVVPFNQGSFGDVDALCSWLTQPLRERVGSTDKLIKAPMFPDIVVPFGAIAETADASSVGPRSLAAMRVMVIGVEKLVAKLAQAHAAHGTGQRMQVILPLSPNHGTFGGDGVYGETKAALEALLNKQASEAQAWGKHASLIGAKIGWVRGTGLMHHNDGVADALHQRGLKTFSTDEMADALLALLSTPVAQTPMVADLTGGLGGVKNLAELLRDAHRARAEAERHDKRVQALWTQFCERSGHPLSSSSAAPQKAPLPCARLPVAIPTADELAGLPALDHLSLRDVIVIVGSGEVGPYGNTRTRWAIERAHTLSLEGAMELAWMMGFVAPNPKGSGFVDVKTQKVIALDEVLQRYEEQILQHTGVRVIEPGLLGFDPKGMLRMVEVRLEQDFAFAVADDAAAATFVKENPTGTEVRRTSDGLVVVRKAGSFVRVPAAVGVDRRVAGQIPTGFDPVRLGVPKDLVDQVDPVTLYCLVSTAEAFLNAGLTPEELLAHLHPGRVGVTIGTGIGGMSKLKRLYRDFYDGADRQNDALQETLINVIGGYVVQAFLGSYGPMSFPVGACATAGLSLAEAVDKIRQGHADLIVAGGADDLSEAGNIGFGDMGATANTEDLLARGVEPKFMSRPSDSRRRGFVEAQGAGVMVVCTAQLALDLGLPVYGVVAFAGSTGDGLQKSVPAPGQGALSLAAETRTDARDPSACDFASRREACLTLSKQRETLAAVVGAERAQAMVQSETRRLAHQFYQGDASVSPLRGALSVLGLCADDIAVVSKHDSSTQANDQNEAQLYATLFSVLGRDADKPVRVISQKALTGHPKGAAAAWQINGLMQAMADGVVPGNKSLDDVDAAMAQFPSFVWSDVASQVPRATLRAGVVTTLGFGHVSAMVVLAHPFLFWRMLDEAAGVAYRNKLAGRLRVGNQRLQSVTSGRAPLFVARQPHHFVDGDTEARILTRAELRMTAAQAERGNT